VLEQRFSNALRTSFLSTVFYLYPSLAQIHTAEPVGSGALIGFPIGNPPSRWMLYVVAPAPLVVTGRAPVGRLNHVTEGVFPLATDADSWHADDLSGLAACLVGLNWKNFDFRFVPLPHCADSSFLRRFAIGVGHEVGIMGVLPSRVLPERNTPQFLTASVLSLPEPSSQRGGKLTIQTDEIPLPGAAAFVFTDDVEFTSGLVGMDAPHWGPWLLGLGMPVQRLADNRVTMDLLPASSLHALLGSPYFEEQRAKYLGELEKEEPRVTAVAAKPTTIRHAPTKKRRRASSKNLRALELYHMITNDFETAWDALANVSTGGTGRGNFMFCRQAMSLLEWVGNVCKGEETGAALNSLSAALAYIDRRYFTQLPPGCDISDAQLRAVPLPTAGHPKNELLAVVFDLARHGLSHQYQQVIASLSDGTDFSVRLTGVEYGRTLDVIRSERPERVSPGHFPTTTLHLSFTKDNGAIFLTVSPAVLYLDIKRAIELTGLLSYMSEFPYVTRRGRYQFSVQSLEQALRRNGHPEFKRPT